MYTRVGGTLSFKSLQQSWVTRETRRRWQFQPQGGSRGPHCGETPPLCSISQPAACENMTSAVATHQATSGRPHPSAFQSQFKLEIRLWAGWWANRANGTHGGDRRLLCFWQTSQIRWWSANLCSVCEAETCTWNCHIYSILARFT